MHSWEVAPVSQLLGQGGGSSVSWRLARARLGNCASEKAWVLLVAKLQVEWSS